MKAINSKFKTAYSRNAAIGRARRMGLDAGPIAGNRRCPPSLQIRRALADSHPGRIQDRLRFSGLRRCSRQPEPPKLRCVEIEPRHLSLIELERGDCRYPYGGDEEGEAITFCGHPRRPGSSYCTPHFHLSRDPAEPPEREWHCALRVVDAMEASQPRMAVRLMPLPRGHRIAHLRALIGLESAGSQRRDELSGLLRDELSDVSAE